MRRGVVGSIPACTGKPGVGGGATRQSTVYPRVYGETTTYIFNTFTHHGLSPRVRGNRRCAVRSPGVCRSIPACTGKP